MEYTFTYGNITRKLPVYEVAGGLKIAYLDTFCDIELVNALSSKMAQMIQDGQNFKDSQRVILLTAVSKGVPFAYTIANNLISLNPNKLIQVVIARKENKKFFGSSVSVEKTSITGDGKSDILYLAEADVNKLRGTDVILLDDMYSTGASIDALEKLARKCGAVVIDKVVAVWETADTSIQPPVKYVAILPLIK
ncbi:MAG: hypothetical protein K2K60_02900 [Clostridia bacterium]|nr:hypothetical protein [Clostridia bacterium]